MKKKNIVLYVTILLVGIIISGFFLPFHTVPDTYCFAAKTGILHNFYKRWKNI